MAKIIDFFDYGPRYRARPLPQGSALIIVLPIVRIERFIEKKTWRRRRRKEGR